MKIKGLKNLKIFEHDLSNQATQELSQEKYLSIDTETGGLDYRKDPLLLIQIANSIGDVFIIKKPNKKSNNIISLLQNPETTLIFHNAAFDIAFLKSGLITEIAGNLQCTKTLMKILFPRYSSGLKRTLKNILNINLNKNIDHSKWNNKELSKRQLQYAACDVIYLYRLNKVLRTTCSPREYNIYCKSMEVIKLKTLIEVEGYTDLFQWEKENQDKNRQNRIWWNKLLLTRHREDTNNVTV